MINSKVRNGFCKIWWLLKRCTDVAMLRLYTAAAVFVCDSGVLMLGKVTNFIVFRY
jgi:hypothetical protein